MHKLFHTTKSDIIEMSWDEIYELMGRLIKLYKQFDEKLYLKFIPITKKRLINGLLNLGKKDLQKYYSNFR